MLTDMENGLYPYNTDGLIFLPVEYRISCTKPGEKSKITKLTWNYHLNGNLLNLILLTF